MDNTTKQVVHVTNIAVTYKLIVEGQVTDTRTIPVTVTPELIAALKLEDAALVEGGYNITVE